MSHDRYCKSKKDKKTNEVGNVPLESYYCFDRAQKPLIG